MMNERSSNNGLFVGRSVAVASIGLVAYMAWRNRQEQQQKMRRKKFHVEYTQHELPMAVKIIGLLPESLRNYLMIQSLAPKMPKDGYDILGYDNNNNSSSDTTHKKYDPYTTKELVPNKIWRVRYEYITNIQSKKELFDLVGVDLKDPAALERTPPNNSKMRQILETDQKWISDCGSSCKKSPEELFRLGCVECQDMLVCKLNNNGGLLLYNPCRIHPPLLEWLQSIGSGSSSDGDVVVEWIVSGSSSHTNLLPQALEAFPKAKLLCAEFAFRKCCAAGMKRPPTTEQLYLYTRPNDFAKAQQQLLEAGDVQIYHVKGDCCTQALWVIAYRHLFEVDLLYSRYCGTIHATADKKEWEKQEETSSCISSDDNDGGRATGNLRQKRLYCYTSIFGNASSNGYLPDFRVMCMDPTSKFMPLLIDKPTYSSCVEMANSLRQLLTQLEDNNFDFVDSVHSDLADSLPADDFRNSIDRAWNWLDGKSLLLAAA